ncbi:lysostaphin resistance A-like protein [Halobacteriales archaeon Cl-PHB]
MDDPLYAVADTETRVRTLAHVLGLVVGAFLAALAFSTLGFAVLGGLGLRTSPMSAEVSAVVSALQFLGFLAVGLWYVEWADARDILHLGRPSLRDAFWILVGLGGLFVLFELLALILTALGVAPATNTAIESGREQPRLLLYFVVVTIVFTAPAEEFLFRGVVQGLFRRAYGVVPGLLIASGVFGVVHYLALTGGGSKVAYLAIAAVLGLVLGAVYEYTESLAVPVAIHGLYNAYQFLLVYAVETGAL